MLIKPVSDLRNYGEVLSEVSDDEPVFLTRNGIGEYAIQSIKEYNSTKAKLALLTELIKGEKSAVEDGFVSLNDLKKKLGVI